jgi:hypothetical protein
MRRYLQKLAPWAALAALFISVQAFGQANNDSTFATPGNSTVPAAVQMCVNAAAKAVPCSTPTAGAGNAGYPPGSTPISAVFSGADTTTATATLTGAAGQFTYICGFTLSGQGATAATTVSPAVTGLTNTLTVTGGFTFVVSAAAFDVPVSYTFPVGTCQPSSAVNTNIVVTLPGAAGNTQANIYAWGYRQ